MKEVDLKVIEDLVLNKGYVFLRTDTGYDPDKLNSIKDHYNLTTIQAQGVKRNPVIQAFIKTLKVPEVVIVDTRVEGTTNNESAVVETVGAEMV